ncbi:MAG: primosomal protein N' [Proteobacteria bacterium]|nr:primosomal protein N' [Pseudomonadota bacterium]
MSNALYAHVAFNVRTQRLFDYLISNSTTDITGLRVLAPFGKKNAVGIVIKTSNNSDIASNKLKTLEHIYTDMPALPAATLALIRFCADYYYSPIGIVTAAALPAFFRRANTYSPPAGYRINNSVVANDSPLKGKAAAIYQQLQQHAATAASLHKIIPNPHSALKKLLADGRIERCHLWQTEAPAIVANEAAAPTHQLSEQQQQALDKLQLSNTFTPHLLFGSTGSGKSEIYLHAAERVLAQQKQVLILTPEIHLTPQLEKYLRARFPQQRLAVLHSNLADGERANRWLMARQGVADIVLGTRLAVFTPMPKLGLIVVDEEHDESYKQEEGLLFSARNLAIWRAKHENIPYLAGSATPSLESIHNAQRDNWQLLHMPARISRQRPQIKIIRESENLYHGMDSQFVRELSTALHAGEQSLIFINRRGYAPTLLCRSCHNTHHCPHCSNSMTVHRRHDTLSCHLCGHRCVIPAQCTSCGGEVLATGSGTQRIEEALTRQFPNINTLRLDRDNIGSGKDSFRNSSHDIETAKIQLLIGTQLIAKGHNFPKLAFIGILNADAALAASDLRAEERLFALLSQVIGRGTRNIDGCRVLIQTRTPNHPFYREIAEDDVNACWQRLLAERQHSAMPPFAHLAVLRGKDKNEKRLHTFMQKTMHAARQQTDNSKVRVFDAIAPSVDKIGDWHRQHILIHSKQRQALHQFLGQFIPTLPSNNNWTIDIDPTTV